VGLETPRLRYPCGQAGKLKKDNRRVSLGRYGSITLQEARRKALTLKGAGPLNGGTDLTLGEAIELFIAPIVIPTGPVRSTKRSTF